ncbi:MAG: hypothetical protein Q4F00_02275 [bacterium]|nr:hypothetical protein [bacterium]
MSSLEALKEILILPSSQPELTQRWLRLAAANLQGFATQPEVIRRSINKSGMHAEVRRWSETCYLPLIAKTVNTKIPGLYFGQDGQLYSRTLDGKRYLRNDPGDKIVDEIYLYTPISNVTAEHLAIVQKWAVLHLLPLGYANWQELSPEHRLSLVTFGGTWANAETALASVSGSEYQQTLQLFLSDKVHPKLRQSVLNAGLDGRLHPDPEVLAWLLAQTDWNLDPCLVAMARSAAADAPEKAWLLIRHPNSQVRLRLIDVYSGEADWLEWLVCETDEQVRSRLLSVIEQSYSVTDLTAQLSAEANSARKEAIGWALAHWRPLIETPQDWQSLNSALFMGIGKNNRKELKEYLAKHKKLSLRGRLFG